MRKNAMMIMLPKNYRPISLLSSLAKIIEKVVQTRLVDECEGRHIVPDEQYGFRVEQQVLEIGEKYNCQNKRQKFL